VLTAAGIVLARRWTGRLERRAQAAHPDPDREDSAYPDLIAGMPTPALNERPDT